MTDPRDEPGYISPDTLDHTPIGFGKYRELTPDQIAEQTPSYLVWAWENVKDRGPFMSDVLYAECQKSKSFVGNKTKKVFPAPKAQPGSVAESRSHFGSFGDYEDDDLPF